MKSSGPAWESGGRSCHSTVVVAFSSFVFIVFSEPDLHNSVAFLKTRAPQPCSPSLSTPTARSAVHAGRQSPARGLHAPESSLFFGAHDGHAPPFFWPCAVGLLSMVVDLRLGGIGDGACSHTLPSPAEFAPASSASFLVFCVVLCILLFLLYSLPVYCSEFIGIFVGLMLDRPSFI